MLNTKEEFCEQVSKTFSANDNWQVEIHKTIFIKIFNIKGIYLSMREKQSV
ncbi:hypothetical protein [Clostridium sp.]|uniref:hypothetical protein n=1 Tax=Clostridium sp. TaxID=1506 RepID=UPI003D6D2594